MMSVNVIADQNNKSYLKVVRIYSAIKEHTYETDIEKLLQTEGDINYRTPEGVPNLLHEVTNRFRNNNLIKLLLNYGFDFTLKDEQGRTVVHRAIHQRTSEYYDMLFQRIFQDEYVDLILAAHVKFENPANPCDENGFSHFHAACMTNNAEAVEFFLKNGVDVNQAVNADSSIFPSYTALELAVRYTSPDVVELLLKHGANVRTKNIEGLGPLHSIIQRKISNCELTDEPRFVRTFNILINFVIDSDMENDEIGFCKLHMACLLGDEILVENILETNFNQRVNSDSPICPGYCALHFAVFSNVPIFKLLLKNGANIEYKNAKGQTPFDLCLQNFTIRDIHSIISSKKEWANITLSDNETKLLTVILLMEDIDKFRSFLDLPRQFKFNRYVPFDSPLWPGYTLLHLAVIFAKKNSDTDVTYFTQKDDINFIEELLKRERDISVADAEGSTALHLAFYMQKHDVVRCLLKYHCTSSLNPTDKNNLSHFHIACASGQEQLVKFFLSNRENVNAPVNSKFDWYTCLQYPGNRGTRHFSICPGSTALHIAVAFGNHVIIDKLLKRGADVYARDANGFTPVHRLLTCRHQERLWQVAKSLLKVGSSKNVTTNCGLSHLHVACYFGHLEAVEKLLKAGADSKVPVTCIFDSRIKDYNEFFCASHGNHHEPWSFLADYSNYTPLEFLWHHKSEECDNKIFWKISFMLIKRDADVFAKNSKGVSMLRSLLRKMKSQECSCLYAMLSENIPTLTRLEEEFGLTKLHLASFLSDAKSVESLLKHGTNVNAKVNSNSPVWQGFTPLHFVVKRAGRNFREKEISDAAIKNIQLLMKYGADPLLVDCNNETIFHEIKRCECHNFSRSALVANLFECIVNYNVNPTDNQGLSVFHIACMAHNKVAVERFLKSGIDVNQSVSGFSNYLPGETSLHLLIEYHRDWRRSPCTDASENETFLQILKMLLEYGADVNVKDATGKTPLFEALRLSSSRRTVIEILIRNGADVHTTIMPSSDTPFELLLRQGDATWEEMELFLKAGCKLNAYNPASREGYMAQVIRYQLATDDIMENEVFNRILNHPKTAEINDAGRTAIHNVVSIDYIKISDDERIDRGKYRSQKFRFWLTPKQKAIRRGEPIYKPTTTDKAFYPDFIEQLCIRGCDIDHEDNEGKTALHLAVAFKNSKAIVSLLKMGADINIIDKNCKTAFAYCSDVSSSNYDSWNDFRGDIVYEDENDLNKVLAVHVYKLEFCGQHVDKQNRILRGKTLSILGPIPGKVLSGFHEEMEATKNVKIGATSLSVYDFLMSADTDFVYMNMNSEERLEIDKFFQNVRQHNFVEIDGLLRLKFRQSIERKKLIEPALESLNLLSKFEIPDLCGRYILKFLKNEDLKRLIASVS